MKTCFQICDIVLAGLAIGFLIGAGIGWLIIGIMKTILGG